MVSVDSSMVPKIGVNVMINRLVKSVPDYNPPSLFRVGVTTDNCVWTDTELNDSVEIIGGLFTKQLESTVISESNGEVVFNAWLSVTEGNGNLLTGIAVVNDDSSEKLIVKAKHPSRSKTNTELFKYSLKVSIKDEGDI